MQTRHRSLGSLIRWLAAGQLAFVLLAANATAAVADEAENPLSQKPSYDQAELSWNNGVVHEGYFRAEDANADGPAVNVYLVGTIDLDHPMETELNPGSPTVHDHVSTFTPYGNRGRCHVYLLLPGPAATGNTVHVRHPVTLPEFSWVTHPYEIDLGSGFVPLVRADRVEAGLTAGLLALSGDLAGGLPRASCWSGAVDTSFPRFD